MANYVLKNAKLYWEGYDLSGRLTSISLPVTQEAKDDTRFSSTSAKTYVPGLKGHSLSYSGYHDNATVLNPDDYIEGEYGSANTIVTVSADGGDEGEKAWGMYCDTASYTPIDGDVGDVCGFNFNAIGTGKVFMGTVMQNGQETTTGSGTARELSGMAEGEVAYLVVHCTELDATTLDIVVHSDETTGMATPVVRDFGQTQFTAIGAQYLTFTAPAGITTDDCWRISYTLAGGNTTATIVATLYIP